MLQVYSASMEEVPNAGVDFVTWCNVVGLDCEARTQTARAITLGH